MDLTTDLQVEILLPLPYMQRRRLRLVCQLWRDLIHGRAPETRKRLAAVPLLVTTQSAYVLDGVRSGTGRELWGAGSDDLRYKQMKIVGSCNGVLCLCDNTKPGGAISLLNPLTGGALALPPIPCAGLFRRSGTRSGRTWHQAYSFGYSPVTGQYRVVHVPCYFKIKDTVHVFTLGEAASRELPAPDARCRLDAGVVSVDGATYWVVEGPGDRIVSFHHENESVMPTKPLPLVGVPISHLLDVRGRVGAAATSGSKASEKIELSVWALEIRRNQQMWTHKCTLRFYFGYRPVPDLQLTRPHSVHGKHLLMERQRQGRDLFMCKSTRVVEIRSWNQDSILSNISITGNISQTFSFVPTAEDLSSYKLW